MQLVSLYNNEKVADIVKNNYRTAGVFKAHGINYCCAGNVSLRQLCSRKNISYAELVRQLNQAAQATAPAPDLQFEQWKTDFLIDYIVNVHNAYLRQAIPELESDLSDFLSRHPHQYPEMQSVASVFGALAASILTELEEQENVVFPYIKQLYSAYRRREPYGKLLVQTLRKPINRTTENGSGPGERLETIRHLLHNYQVTERICTGYGVLTKRLHDFDNHFVLHKHLENNILFPAVIQMEEDLLGT